MCWELCWASTFCFMGSDGSALVWDCSREADPLGRRAHVRSGLGKWVCSFSAERAEGRGEMRNLLGGKGANLPEMTHRSARAAGLHDHHRSLRPLLQERPQAARRPHGRGSRAQRRHARKGARQEVRRHRQIRCSFRSAVGRAVSMPGMMNTILNLGLNDESVVGLANATGNERFAYDSYRRFIKMYGDVVLRRRAEQFRGRIRQASSQRQNGQTLDTDAAGRRLDAKLRQDYKASLPEALGKPFPQDPLKSSSELARSTRCSARWMNPRAVTYRRLNNIPARLGHRRQRPDDGVRQHGRRLAPPASPSPATRPPARTSSTASS